MIRVDSILEESGIIVFDTDLLHIGEIITFTCKNFHGNYENIQGEIVSFSNDFSTMSININDNTTIILTADMLFSGELSILSIRSYGLGAKIASHKYIINKDSFVIGAVYIFENSDGYVAYKGVVPSSIDAKRYMCVAIEDDYIQFACYSDVCDNNIKYETIYAKDIAQLPYDWSIYRLN